MDVQFLHHPCPVRFGGLYDDSHPVARLGGDEFVVLALQTGDRFEEIIHRRLTRALRATKSIGNGCSLSLSVGTARFDPKRAVTLGELMSQADKAMYAQKRS